MGPLLWSRIKGDVLQPKVVPVVSHILPGPEAPHHLQRLVGAAAPLLHVESGGSELYWVLATDPNA
jgi:hypothetical protein